MVQQQKAVVLVSGGLDSVTALAIAQEQEFDCYALSVDYGQPPWKQQYADAIGSEKSVGKRWRFGADFWTTLDTNVDLTQALDLDIDLVPNPGDPDTQWRPRYPEKIYARSFKSGGNGSFSIPEVTTDDNYADTGNWWFSHCPAQARKLDEMTTEELDTYLTTLQPYGATYHDIGMIWGGRLMSPTGLFASENQDVPGAPSGRHMIFLTDGQTEPYDLAYGAYGVEGLDVRRWAPGGAVSLAKTVEARFGVACEEVKKRNVSVWVIAFGTEVNDAMTECAGEGRYFEAANSEELEAAFKTIAGSLGDLRISG